MKFRSRKSKHILWPLALAIAAVDVIVIAFAPSSALAYSCGTPGANHCYAVHWWNGGITGSQTKILVSSGYYNSGLNFISNEMWLEDLSSSICVNSFFHECWVEAGYLVWQTAEQYFWADVKPGDTSINNNYQGLVPAGDIGHYTTVRFWTNYGSWSVLIQSSNFNSGGVPYYSYPNSMGANRITIGTELSGSSGASEYPVYFDYNQYRDSTGTYSYQFRDGDYDSPAGGPPYWVWYVKPSHSSTGGRFSTQVY